MMAKQHPNVLNYMRAIQAFNENDLNTVKETTSENCVYRIAGRSPLAGEHRGIEQFGRMLQLAKELSGNTIAFEPKVVLADDRYVMVYGRAKAKRGEKTLDIDHAYLYQFGDDGKFVEGRTIPVDLYAFDEFWS
jgi:ketosteroid isomerase-like protein